MENRSTEGQSLEPLIATFLIDLAHANHSLQTCRAYTADLVRLCPFHQGPVQTITADVLRTFFEMQVHLRPATRARKQAAVARFLTWAEQQDLLEANPMHKIDRVKLDPPQPRGVERSQIVRTPKQPCVMLNKLMKRLMQNCARGVEDMVKKLLDLHGEGRDTP